VLQLAFSTSRTMFQTANNVRAHPPTAIATRLPFHAVRVDALADRDTLALTAFRYDDRLNAIAEVLLHCSVRFSGLRVRRI
jgi:hypothetical protein